MGEAAKGFWWAVPYGITMAALYLMGYWSPFGVNALEYIGLSDIAKLAIFPLIAVLASVLVGVWIGINGGPTPKLDWLLEGKEGERPFVVLLASLLFFLSSLFLPDPTRWFAMGMFALIACMRLRVSPLMKALFPNPAVLALALGFGPMLLFLSFGHGRKAAVEVLEGRAPHIVVSRRTSVVLRSDIKHPVAYLGRLGDTLFFYESLTKAVVSARAEQTQTLVFVNRPERRLFRGSAP